MVWRRAPVCRTAKKLSTRPVMAARTTSATATAADQPPAPVCAWRACRASGAANGSGGGGGPRRLSTLWGGGPTVA